MTTLFWLCYISIGVLTFPRVYAAWYKSTKAAYRGQYDNTDRSAGLGLAVVAGIFWPVTLIGYAVVTLVLPAVEEKEREIR